MEIEEYRKQVLIHARKLGYGEPIVLSNRHHNWIFTTSAGTEVSVNYDWPSRFYERPLDPSLVAMIERGARSAKYQLSRANNVALGIRPKQRKPRAINPNHPSKRFDTDWLDAFGPDFNDYPEELEAGKWIMHVRDPNMDEVWTKIKAAVEEGRLAFYAKISTAGSKSFYQPYVLCVYVPDCRDREAAMLVRERLRAMGFERKIPFKSDSMTEAGISGSLFSA